MAGRGACVRSEKSRRGLAANAEAAVPTPSAGGTAVAGRDAGGGVSVGASAGAFAATYSLLEIGPRVRESVIGACGTHLKNFDLASWRRGGPLCPVGPMTNIATAIVKQPRILPKLREIAFMGGAALVPGNVTPVAEFNIHADPHAAEVVLQSGVDLTMFGLDVTHKAITTPARLEAIRALGTPVAEAAAGMLAFYDRADIEHPAYAPAHPRFMGRTEPVSLGRRVFPRPHRADAGFGNAPHPVLDER